MSPEKRLDLLEGDSGAGTAVIEGRILTTSKIHSRITHSALTEVLF